MRTPSTGGSIWRSTDKGVTWQSVVSPPDSPGRGESVTFVAGVKGGVFVVVSNIEQNELDGDETTKKSMRSTDGGLTWTLISVGDSANDDQALMLHQTSLISGDPSPPVWWTMHL
jgi:hypothetical protein